MERLTGRKEDKHAYVIGCPDKCNQNVIEMQPEESLGIHRKVWSKCCPKCKYEDDNEGISIYYSCDWDGGIGFERDVAIFCPKCGRPLTTEAWNKLEERLKMESFKVGPEEGEQNG